jgi:predicted DNA-binding transcriptional regulator AlpA
MDDLDQYLPSSAVKRRYGHRSDMALWRWLRDPKLDFPKPIVISRRRYWALSELRRWEKERAAAGGQHTSRTS